MADDGVNGELENLIDGGTIEKPIHEDITYGEVYENMDNRSGGVTVNMKKFNLTGLCIPEKHYMVDLTERVDHIIEDYIDQGAYFTINRARQFGKTTMLSFLQRRLSGRYLVIRLSFEGVDDNAGKGVVLLIDEVDKCSDNQVFLNFPGMLRNKYLDMQEELDISFQSIVLAGVYDVKNLKLKLRSDEEKKYNSPWNIAADFQIDMSFTVNEIVKMLEEYCKDTGTEMDVRRISEQIHFYTGGYPFLVSWFCKWMGENSGRKWTSQSVKDAEKDGTVAIANVVFETYLYNHMIAGKILEKYSFGIERNTP